MAIELGSATGKIEIDASGVASGIEAARSSLAGAEGSLASLGSSATSVGVGMMGLSAPLLALGGTAAKTAGDFESSMNTLSIAARGSGTSLEDLRSVAITAGQDTRLVGVSASDVAEAMTNFAKAGLDTNATLGDMQGYLGGTAEMGGALRGAIDLAAASELDLDQASQLAVITMSTFGLTADEVVGAMNNYVQTADASVASVSGLADAMANIGPTAAAFGFSLEDTNAALAVLSTRGIQGSEAGTALKSMLVNMMRDTPDVKQALNDLNVSLYDQAGNMRPLPAIMADLERGMAGMTEEQRNQYVQTLAGTYGMKAMNTLLAEGKAGWDKMKASIGGASTMQDTAKAKTQGFNAAMENLKSVMEGFLINVGTPLIRDVLTPLAQKFAELIGHLATMNPKFLEIAIIGAGVVAGLGGLLVAFGQVATAVSAIAALFGAGGVLAGIGAAVSAAFAAVAPVILPIIAIIAGLVAAVLLLKAAWENNFLGIRDIAETIWKAIKAVFEDIKRIVGAVFDFLSGKISMKEMLAKIGPAWENIKRTISNAVANIKKTVGPIFERIGQLASAAWEGIKTAAVAKWEEIKAAAGPAWENVKTTISQKWEDLKTAAGTAWENIKRTITTAVDNLGLSEKWEGIKSAVAAKWEDLKTAAGPAWEGIKAKITTVIDNLGLAEKWEAIRTRAGEIWETIFTTISGIVTRIKNFVVDTVGAIVTAAADLFGRIIDALTGGKGEGGVDLKQLLNVGALRQTVSDIIGIIREMRTTVEAELALIPTSFDTTWTAVQVGVGPGWSGITTAVVGAARGIGGALAAALVDAGQWLDTTWNALRDAAAVAWTTMTTTIVTAAQNAATEMVAGFNLALAAAQPLADMERWHGDLVQILRDAARDGRAGASDVAWAIAGGFSSGLSASNPLADFYQLSSDVLRVLGDLAGDAYGAGLAVGLAVGDGIYASIGHAVAAATALAQAVANILPHSDAKEGPLSHLTDQGRALPATWASGIVANTAEATTAARRMAAEVAALLDVRGAAVLAPAYMGVNGAGGTRGVPGGPVLGQQIGGRPAVTVNVNVDRMTADVDVEAMAYRVGEIVTWRRGR